MKEELKREITQYFESLRTKLHQKDFEELENEVASQKKVFGEKYGRVLEGRKLEKIFEKEFNKQYNEVSSKVLRYEMQKKKHQEREAELDLMQK